MSAKLASLALYLDAPMIGCGVSGFKELRASNPYPTKSEIVGLLAAALGVDRSDDAGKEAISQLDFSIIVFQYSHKRNSSEILPDYCAIGAGYAKIGYKKGDYTYKDFYEYIPKKPSGLLAKNKCVKKEYIHNSKFGCVVTGERSFIEKLEAAMERPKWGYWIGRKSCIPCTPIAQKVHDTPKLALAELENVSGLQADFVVISSNYQPGVMVVRDEVVSFQKHQHRSRYVREVSPTEAFG